MSYAPGDEVLLNDGRRATVRYVGPIHLANGQFVGCELQTATGKHNGTVGNQTYFNCPDMTGLMVRPSGILRKLEKAVPAPATVPQPKTPKSTVTSRASRPSSVGGLAKTPAKSASASSATSATSNSRMSLAPSTTRKSSFSTPATSTQPPSNKLARPSLGGPRTAPSSSSTNPPAQPSRDANLDTLKTKVKHLEKQHADDREKLKDLENIKNERDKFETIIQKLQSKCQTYHQDVNDLKAQMQEKASELERLTKLEQDHETTLEMATLDREMAEERAENAMAEALEAKQRWEEAELELDILRSEADFYTETMSDEAKAAAVYHTLQTKNTRLEQLIFALKDRLDDSVADLNARTKELEAEQADTEELRAERDRLQSALSEAESIVDHLRQQVDAANEWEEMIEDLSGQNQFYKEQIAEKNVIIQDLENLKELNDELETHHIEQSNELRADLDAKDAELAEQARRITQQDATIVEQYDLIIKFRDLVTDLKSKADMVEADMVLSEEQTKDVTGRFHEVMEMNRQLKTANLASLEKDIASQLNLLEARQLMDNLIVVKNYIDNPEVMQNDPLDTYFRAKRIEFKSKMMSDYLREHGEKYWWNDAKDEPLINLMRLDTIHELDILNTHACQCWAAIDSSSVEQFLAFGPVFSDLDTVEKTLDRFIDSFKKDDVNYQETAQSLRRCNQVVESIASEFPDAFAARIDNELIFRVANLKAHYDLIAKSFESVMVLFGVFNSESIDKGWYSQTNDVLIVPRQASLRGALAADGFRRVLAERQQDGLYPNLPTGIHELREKEEALSQIARASWNFTKAMVDQMLAIDITKTPVGPEIRKALASLKLLYFPNEELVQIDDVLTKINLWNEYTMILANNVEIEKNPAPWDVRAEQIKLGRMRDAEIEKKYRHLTDEYQSTLRQFREREQVIETKELQIEHLKAKHREAVTKVEGYDFLQEQLDQAHQELQSLQTTVEQQHTVLHRLKEQLVTAQNSEPATKATAQSTAAIETNNVPMPGSSNNGHTGPIVQALTNENQWLRRCRIRSSSFGVKFWTAMSRERELAQIQQEAKAQRKVSGLYKSVVNEPSEAAIIEADEPASPVKKPYKFSKPLLKARSPSPLVLTPMSTNTNWTPRSFTPFSTYSDLEDLSFIDPSPVEEFDESALEAFREIMVEL